jgi:hypothetical protein
MKISPRIFSWMLLPVMALWCVAAYIFVFDHPDFERSSFWSSSFFAVQALILAFAGIRVHLRFSEKVQFSRFESVIIAGSVSCSLVWTGIICYAIF